MNRVLLFAFSSIVFSTPSLASDTTEIQRYQVVHPAGKTESIIRVQARETKAELDYQLYLDIQQQAHDAIYEFAQQPAAESDTLAYLPTASSGDLVVN